MKWIKTKAGGWFGRMHFTIKVHKHSYEGLNEKAKALGFSSYRDFVNNKALDIETQLHDLYDFETKRQ